MFGNGDDAVVSARSPLANQTKLVIIAVPLKTMRIMLLFHTGHVAIASELPT